MNTIEARGQFTAANAVLRKARKKFYEETAPSGKVSQIQMAKIREKCRRRRLFFAACPNSQMDTALIRAWIRIEFYGSYDHRKPPMSFYYEYIEAHGLLWWFPGGEKELRRLSAFYIGRTA